MTPITLSLDIEAPLARVWRCFTEPQHIRQWNFAHESWHCPRAEHDLRAEGSFNYRMEARDGSFGFDFAGTFDEILPFERIRYHLGDGRSTTVQFASLGDGRVRVTETFEPEAQNDPEMQKNGWMAILENFRRHVETDRTHVTPDNTVCLMFERDAEAAARFYTGLFANSHLNQISRAPADYPGGKQGDVLVVNFTVAGVACMAINGGPYFKHSEAFSFQIATDSQEETDRYWNAIIDNGGSASDCGWCKDRWGISWQITPRLLTDALALGGDTAQRAFAAMMQMQKIDIATIQAAISRP